jgi:type II restriction/modification system DNA methylase subunit YeeA
MKELEEENNRLFIEAYGLEDELTPEVPEEEITLFANPKYRYGSKLSEDQLEERFRTDTIKELISYSVGCMMGRYSLDEPGLIYAHSANEGFDPGRYRTFPADDDGVIPITELEWFEDDITARFVKFIRTVWGEQSLHENLEFIAQSLGQRKSETPRETIRRYFTTDFFKDHLRTYKKRPIYWLFTSGKKRGFQALVYLHRYNEATLARMRTEYVIPLQRKIEEKIKDLEKDKEYAGSTSEQNRIQKLQDKLIKQSEEIKKFEEKLRHYADKKIKLDLDGGVKANYGKFGDLLAEVKSVTGKKAARNE